MKDAKTCVVILSRFSSSRLPGKALRQVCGKELLGHIIEKVATVVPREQIVVATSIEESDNAIAEYVKTQNVHCYRGSLDNVAERFFKAAEHVGCEYACRINGDNIFLDTSLLIDMIQKVEQQLCDFASNVKDRTYPKGMSVEIVSMDYYKKWLPTINADAYLMEHVMVYLYGRADQDQHVYFFNTELPEAAGIDLALDTMEDFNRSEWIMKKVIEENSSTKMVQILKLNKEYEQHLSR